MDPVKNPFFPGAGTQPAKLAGRDDLLDRLKIMLERSRQGRHSKSVVVYGLRGVGKTVLLSRAYDDSKSLGFHAAQIEATGGKSFASLLVPRLRQILIDLDKTEAAADYAKRGLRALAGFVGSIRARYGDIEFGMSIKPERGLADSGNLVTDLPDLFEAIADAAKAKGTVVALVIDELQYLDEDEMNALIMSMHRISQRNLPFIMVGGGLPQLLSVAGDAKSYAERLFDYTEIGHLSKEDAFSAIRDPILSEEGEINLPALEAIYKVTRGYPFFLQVWGHYVWNEAKGPRITKKDVDAAAGAAIASLDEGFFKMRLGRMTTAEKSYMFAMASLGEGPHKSGDIASAANKKVESVAPVRSSLISKGVIYAPSHGMTGFTVPLFDEYLHRVRKSGFLAS